MSLPVLNRKIFKTEILSTGQEVNFRPYSLGEQKLIMIGKDQAGNNEGLFMETLIAVTSKCVEGVDLKSLYTVDIQKLFYDIKSVAAGNRVEFTMSCKNPSCVTIGKDQKPVANTSPQFIDTTHDLEAVNLGNLKTQVELVDDKITLNLEQPKIKDAIRIKKQKGLSDNETAFAVLPYALKSAVQGEHVYTDFTIEEASAWFDSIQDPKAIQQISEFFKDSPALITTKKFNCPHCGQDNEMTREEVQSFFT